jgi:hypothetical protein
LYLFLTKLKFLSQKEKYYYIFLPLQKNIIMAKSKVNHPAMVAFRKLIIQDRIKETANSGKIVRSIKHKDKFGFISNTYFNQIENGIATPSLETFLDMIDIMGYDIHFVPKNQESVSIQEGGQDTAA